MRAGFPILFSITLLQGSLAQAVAPLQIHPPTPLNAVISRTTEAVNAPLLIAFRDFTLSIALCALIGQSTPLAAGMARFSFRPSEPMPTFLAWWHALLSQTVGKDPQFLSPEDLEALSTHLLFTVTQSAIETADLSDPNSLKQRAIAARWIAFFAEQTLHLLKDTPAHINEDEIQIFNLQRRLIRLMEYAKAEEAAVSLLLKYPLIQSIESWKLFHPMLTRLGWDEASLYKALRTMEAAANDGVDGLFLTPLQPFRSPRGWIHAALFSLYVTWGWLLSFIPSPDAQKAHEKKMAALSEQASLRREFSFSDYTLMTRKRWAIKKRSPTILASPDGRQASLDLILVMAGPHTETLKAQVQELENQLHLPPLPIIFYDAEVAGPEASPLQDPLEAEIYLRGLWKRLTKESPPAFKPIRDGLPFEYARIGVIEIPADEGPYAPHPTPFGYDAEDAGEKGMGTFLENVLDILYHAEAYRQENARCVLLVAGHPVDLRPANRGVPKDLLLEGYTHYRLYLAWSNVKDTQVANQKDNGFSRYGAHVPVLNTYERRRYPLVRNQFVPGLRGFYVGDNAIQSMQERVDPRAIATGNNEARTLVIYTDLLDMTARKSLPTRLDNPPRDAWDISLGLYHIVAVGGRRLMKEIPLAIAPLTIPYILVALVIRGTGYKLDNYRAQALEELAALKETPWEDHEGRTWHDAFREFLDALLSHIDTISALFKQAVHMSVVIPPPEGGFWLMWTDPVGSQTALEQIARAPRLLSDETFQALPLPIQKVLSEIRANPASRRAYRHLTGMEVPHFWEVSKTHLSWLQHVATHGWTPPSAVQRAA